MDHRKLLMGIMCSDDMAGVVEVKWCGTNMVMENVKLSLGTKMYDLMLHVKGVSIVDCAELGWEIFWKFKCR